MDDAEDTTVLGLLDDTVAKAILELTSRHPMSANDLQSEIKVSPPTIYRRIETLQSYDLIEATQELDADGNHYQTYVANLEHVAVDLENGELSIDIRRTERTAADRFTSLYERL